MRDISRASHLQVPTSPDQKRSSIVDALLDWKCMPTSTDMTLPVSSYEELLARVRSLTHETIQLQRELTTPLTVPDHNDNHEHSPCCGGVLGVVTCDNDAGSVAASGGWTTTTSTSAPDSRRCAPAEDVPEGWRSPDSRKRFSRATATDSQHNGGLNSGEWSAAAVLARLGVTLANNKENVMDEPKEEDEKTRELSQCKENEESEGAEGAEEGKMSSSTQTQQHSNGAKSENLSSLYHGTWPVERSLWHSGPSSIGGTRSVQQDVSSVMSFTSSVGSGSGGLLLPNEVSAARRTYSQQQLGAKVEMVYSLLSMLGTHDREDMSRTLLAMSSSPDSCAAMRQSGCLPLLVQLLHAPDSDADTRQRAAQALHNMVHSHPDDKRGRREARVLRLLEQIREYCDLLREAINSQQPNSIQNDMERHPGPTIAALMKLSFDEEHRHAMCQLGGLHAIAELIQVDHEAHGSTTGDQYCVTLRRYAGMALTNLTFGDGANKALLCSFRPFMRALVAQLKSPSEDLRQVTASVLRNLSWRADGASKQTLREVGAVTGLMRAAMEGKKESTLKSILSALWNLSAHCSMNKVDICAVEGALGFLVDMLSYKAPSKTLAIVENAGGILRNISSHIAVREDYRAILREHNCLQVLLQQLKSPSLTVVSNACGTLWNLSARCAEDQRALWEMGAASMLRSLVHSKHKMISMGSSAALKNLLSARPGGFPPPAGLSGPSAAGGLGLPGLYARKQRALEQELDQTLAETCENIEPSTSPSSSTILRDEKFVFSATEQNQRTGSESFDRQHISRMFHSQASGRHQSRGAVARSDSRDSVTSTLSDTVYERVSRTVLNLLASPTTTGLTGSISDSGRINAGEGSSSDRHFLHRYCNTMRQRQEEKNAEGSGDDDTDQQHREEPDEQPSSQAAVVGAAAVSAATYHDAVKSTVQDSIESRLTSTQMDQTHTSSSSAAKQPTKNILYEGTRSAFNPIVPAGVFGSAAHRGQFLRTKYSDLVYDDDAEAQEQPVDYSLKYVEEQGLTVSDKPDDDRGKQTQNDLGRGFPPFHHHHGGTSKNMKLNVVYGDYAETDLDQPTDYSLKYAEEDEEEAEAEYRKNEVESDTLKTYCTEGTPYETPYNFSTATSMSDLHCEQPKSEKSPENYTKDESLEHSVVKNACDDSDIVKVVDTSNLNKGFEEKSAQVKSLPPTQTATPRQPIMSPEKPVQYCEEDTPACFSRMSSLSSLSSAAAVAQETPAEAEGLMKVAPIDKQPLESPEAAGPKVEEQQREREGKVVTFGGADHYAEETPLMFSRCSSLGSLSSFEQHSIHDDRSSVISDFSRRTSGIVSPSELPDSPTQTVPASPRSTKPPVEFINRLPEDSRAIRSQPAGRQAAGRNGAVGGTMKSSVFEDEVVAFKVEDTPFEFSRATSLSSLSIDDEPKISNDAMLKEVVGKQRVVGTVPIPAGIHHHQQQHRMTEEGMEKQDTEKEKRGELADCCELPPVSEGEEENDEDMLAACITIGMQNSRQRQQNQYSSRRDKIAPLCGPQQPVPNRFQPVSRGATSRPSGIPVKSITPSNSQRQGKQRQQQQQHTDPRGKPINYMEIGAGPCDDTVRTYCTEGTPANISHAGSHSDLSVLSLAGDGDEIESAAKKTGEDESRPPELSDDSSNLSGDNDNILAECIQSGMPKARSPMVRRTVAQPSEPSKATAVASGVNAAVLPPRRPARPPAHHLCGLDHYRPPQSPPGRNRRAMPITAALPHSKQQMIKDTTAKLNRAQNLAARDELETYATEGSPNTFSTRSSLSDLTINSTEVAALASNLNRNTQQAAPPAEGMSHEHPVNYNIESASLELSHAASLNSLTLEEDHYSEGPKLGVAVAAAGAGASDLEPSATLMSKVSEEGQAMTASDGSWGDKSHKMTSCSVSEDVVTVLSRNGSLSSLSVDSFGSTEPSEQALLEQCISSGMPKSRTEHQSAAIAKPRIPVPVSASGKRKIAGSKIPHAIPSMPMQKLELKPSALKSYRSEEATDVEREMACLSLYDVPRTCDDLQIPKNGVESSAAMQEEIVADEADANTAADITKENFLQDQVPPVENNQHLEEGQEMERGYLHAPAISSVNVSSADRNEECVVKETKETKTSAACNKNDASDFQSDLRSPLSPPQYQDQSPESRIQDWRKDPDAMIASLDRLTEELVQQAQDLHEQKEKNKEGVMKQSAVGSDTWNEDTSPNDVSFPSMSISAPLVASFRSDNLEDPAATGGLGNLAEEEPQDSSPGGLPDLVEEVADLPDASPSGVPNLIEEEVIESSTDSPDPHLLELEARKLAVAVQAEGLNLPSMEHSLTSLNSMDIDAIKPPSMMGSLVSLTTSLSGQLENPECSLETPKGEQGSGPMPQNQARSNGSGRLECRHTRKKSLPLGMMVRRALGNSNSAHNGSTENLQTQQDSISSSCNSHLDNIKPPSAMEDAIDVADMENSMVSVASITSEVADASSVKEHSNSDQNSDGAFDLLRPAASIMADVYAAQYPAAAAAMTASRSASDCIDNINPPSAFNEIADLGDVEESAAEPGTETICSDTEMCTEEPGYAHSMERLDEAPDLPPDNCSGSRKSTPVPQTSDQSSAESTPKKHPQRQQLTPKQRRQLVKERYKTYTIAGEEAEKVNIAADDEQNKPGSDVGLNESGQDVSAEDNELKDKTPNKVTPKQRRQEDRQRFQTRILDKSPIIDAKSVAEADIAETEASDCLQEMPSRPEDANYERVDIRDRGTKTLKQKRAEAKERFRTHTLKDDSRPQMTLNVTSNHDMCQEAPAAQVTPLTGPGFVEAFLNVTPEEIESLLEHDANIVITTINSSCQQSELPNSEDMLLECETLSLISIESESEHNSNTYRVTGRRRGSDNFVRENSLSDRDKENNVSERMHEEMEDVKVSMENSEESDEEEDEAAQMAKGPRIVKPEERQVRDGSAGSGSAGDDGTGSQTNSPKAIRGRRKALYSSPASKKGTTSSPTSRAATKNRSSIPVVSSVTASSVRTTRASELRQTGQRSTSRTPPSSAESRSPRNASPKTASRLTKKTVSSPPPRTPTSAKNTTSGKSGTTETEEVADPRFKPPERQGTFTKDDSSVPNAPQVQTPPSPTRTKIPVPASVLKTDAKNKKAPVSAKGSIPAARARVRKDTSVPLGPTKTSGQGRPPRTQGMEINSSGNLKSLSKAATIPGRNGTIQPSPATRLAGNKRRSMGTLEGMKTSLSNQSLHSSDGKTSSRQHPSTPPQRSNSNCSINSASLGKKTKKEVTSKIASLWKRVEESKSKQKSAKKDTRVWISGAEVNGESGGKSAPASRLVRSSTFEGLPSKAKPEEHHVADEETTKTAAAAQQSSNTQKLVAEVVSVQSREQDNGQAQQEVVRRQQRPASEELNNPKRLSRLGSFIRIEGEGSDSKAPKPTAAAVVPPFNYNPPVTVATTPSSHIPTLVTKRSVSYVSGMSDGHTEEISTASMRVTTV